MRLNSFIAYMIVSFVVGMALSLDAEKSEAAEVEPYMYVGGQANVSDASMGGVGVIYDGKIDLNVTYVSEGNTPWGKHESMRVTSLTRIVTPGWYDDHFFMGLGYANVQHTLLVGEHNYHLMVGVQYNWGRIYYSHISDFDIGTNDNTGLDSINIGLFLGY